MSVGILKKYGARKRNQIYLAEELIRIINGNR